MSGVINDINGVLADPGAGWNKLTTGQKALVGVAVVGGVGAGFGLAALSGSLIGVGATAGVVWNVSSMVGSGAASLASSGSVDALKAMGKQSSKPFDASIKAIINLAATVFGGALGLMAYSKLGFSAALLASAKLIVVGSCIALGTIAAVVLVALAANAIAEKCMKHNKAKV